MRTDTFKILIVDDSRVFRNVVEEILRAEKGIEITGSAWNGAKGIEFLKANPPDLVTLDVEMPEMNGIDMLREIMEFNRANPDIPDIGVIMVSAYTKKGADVTISALELGAYDFIPKPSGGDAGRNMAFLRQELLGKIRNYRSGGALYRGIQLVEKPPVSRIPRPLSVPVGWNYPHFKAVVIGVSTGGPKALAALLPALCEGVKVPVFVVQHMPATFTLSLAENLDRKCAHRVIEAVNNDIVARETVYIAPGGRHMAIRRDSDGRIVTEVNDLPPERGCRPSVDILFRSAAAVYNGDVIAIVLTGMGSDGTKGLAPLRRAGALVIAQDESSCVVWGMPGSAVASGLVDHVLPLIEIGPFVGAVVSKGGER